MGAQTQAGVSGVADLEKRRKGKGLRQGGREGASVREEEEGEGYRQGGRGLLGAHH